MNILYIVHDNKMGGAALSFIELISLVRNEHNVYVITPHKDGFIPKKLDEMKISHFSAHYFWWNIALPHNKVLSFFKLFIYKALNIWNYVEAYRIRKTIQRLQIDIIHSNSSVINFGALLSKVTAIPHIWHLREYGQECGLKRVVSAKRYRNVMNTFATSYIAISQAIKKKFSEIVNEDKISQIYNGVSEEYSYKKDFLQMPSKKIKFLISGNYCREKGQVDVIYAVNRLIKQGIDRFEVYIAGKGNFTEPKKLVDKYHLQDYVTFCGCVEDMIQLRKDVDVEIVATKFEAFGRVTIEAMRMSNPVIGTNTGGTPELIKDGYNGFLFKYADYIELADNMKRFIVNEELIEKMGKNAYLEMKSKFTPRENADRILKLYKVVGKKSKLMY